MDSTDSNLCRVVPNFPFPPHMAEIINELGDNTSVAPGDNVQMADWEGTLLSREEYTLPKTPTTYRRCLKANLN